MVTHAPQFEMWGHKHIYPLKLAIWDLDKENDPEKKRIVVAFFAFRICLRVRGVNRVPNGLEEVLSFNFSS